MRKPLYLFKVSMALLGLAALSQSCTNLDERVYDNIIPSNFYKTAEENVSALGAAYQKLGGYATGDLFSLQEASTDEMVVPTRGSDWDDGGNWRRLHLHSWKYEDNATSSAWDFCFTGVNSANMLIYQFNNLKKSGTLDATTADAYASELAALRGFFYWQLIDLYGNVPLVTDWATAESAPANSSRTDVFNWVVNDLETSVPKLTKTVDGTTYARMNYYAGEALLAKLYLNAKVYTGTEMYDKCIAACNEIINSGSYSLESNFFTNFNVASSTSKEFIFAIPYDKVFMTGFELAEQTLHYGNQDTYNLTSQPWNGYCTLEQFYNSFDSKDIRKGEVGTLAVPASKRGTFLAGYQFKSSGAIVIDDGADKGDPDGKPVNLGNIGDGVPQINELGPAAWRQSGVRIGKWEFEMGSTSEMNNDYGVFRYADILLMKAEALWRKSGSATDANALALVNQVRERAGLTDLTSLDGPVSFDPSGPSVAGGELFNEIGREMAFEHGRRQQLIRWGFWDSLTKWNLPYNNVGDVLKTGSYLTIFPISKAKLSANPNLTQNPGY